MAGSDGAVAQRLSPQDVTQHELTPAYSLSAGPTILWYAAASGLGQRRARPDGPATAVATVASGRRGGAGRWPSMARSAGHTKTSNPIKAAHGDPGRPTMSVCTQ